MIQYFMNEQLKYDREDLEKVKKRWKTSFRK